MALFRFDLFVRASVTLLAVVAATRLPAQPLANGVNPANLGKGDWIWQIPQTETHLGVSSTQAIIDYEVGKGMSWITVKCGDGSSIWTQFSPTLVQQAHAAGLKIFGWAYAYGSNPAGEANVAINALNLGADGFIIDAESEYESLANNSAAAAQYCQAIRAAYPNTFLAHAPFPYISYHSGFPYVTFGLYCDAVMPQDYWGAIGVSPTQMVADMDPQWSNWQNALTGTNRNAIKPIVPLAQSYAPVTGAEITTFVNALKTDSHPATAGGYQGVSFWDAQERTADMDAAVAAATIGTSYALTNIWGITSGFNLDTANHNRGLAYDAISNLVYVPNGATPSINVFNGTTGASIGTANTGSGIIAGGNLLLDQVAVADDGALYAVNLQAAIGGPVKLYRWSQWNQPPTAAYTLAGGDPINANLAGGRLGDNLAVRGSGTNTLLLAGAVGNTNFVLWSTTDGASFTPSVLRLTNSIPLHGYQFGIAFYTNNTFLFAPNAASGNTTLYLVQYPANFASLPSPMAAVVLATNTLNGNYLDLAYNSTAGLLATHPNGTTAVNLYTFPATNFGGFSLVAGATFSFALNGAGNGNETGGIALGGPGKSTLVFALDTNTGLQGSGIGYNPARMAPSIVAAPQGGTAYTNTPSFTFSGRSQGTQPLHYQWQFNSVSNAPTAANIPGATNASYTLVFPPVSTSGWYDVVVTNLAGSVTSALAQLTVLLPATRLTLTPLWTLAPGSRAYLDSASYDARGLGFDTNTLSLLVANKGAAFGIYVLNSADGSDLFALNTTGLGTTGNQFSLDQVGVADDGAVYAGNLVLAGSGAQFAVWRWPAVAPSTPPAQAYPPGGASSGYDPGNNGGLDRWGDTLAVRGAGTNTQILLGSYLGFGGGPATNVAILTTADGTNFNATTIAITNLPASAAGFASLGIAWGAGNTFWAKSVGHDLFEVAFDLTSGRGSLVQDIASAVSGAASFSALAAPGVDPQNNLLAGVGFDSVPNNLSLFLLGATNTLPALYYQTAFPSANGSGQQNGVTVVKYPRIFSLDANNGLVALTYAVTPTPFPPFSITSVARGGGGVTFTWSSVAGRVYQVQYKNSLSDSFWATGQPSIYANGPNTTFTDTSAGGASRFYRIVSQ